MDQVFSGKCSDKGQVILLTVSVSSQAYVFLFSIIGGALAGLIYDIFRIKRRMVQTGKWITCFEDICYWVIIALIMFMLICYSNEGEIRGYIFAGNVIGAVLYILLLSRITRKLLILLIESVIRLFGIIWKVLSYPFTIIYKILDASGKFVLKYIKNVAEHIKIDKKIKMIKKAFCTKIKKIKKRNKKYKK